MTGMAAYRHEALEYIYSASEQLALTSLAGICQRLVADQLLHETELAALFTWLAENAQLLAENEDFFDIADIVQDILGKGAVSHGELGDLQVFLESAVSYRDHFAGASLM